MIGPPEFWDNLEQQAKQLQQLLEARKGNGQLQQNRAWRAKLRLAIVAIAGFRDGGNA